MEQTRLEGDKELGSATHHPSRGLGGLSTKPRWKVTEAEALNPSEVSVPIKGVHAFILPGVGAHEPQEQPRTSLVPALLGPLAPDGDRRLTRSPCAGTGMEPLEPAAPPPGWPPPGPAPSAR